MRVLFAEDDPIIASHVAETLRAAGYEVEHCSSGRDAWDLGSLDQFDIVVLDLGLPDLDGLTLLRRWRRDGHMMPVLILSARGSWMERVDGFDAGADDYLPKPFRNEELLARLKALLRRSTRALPDAAAAGRFRHDTLRKIVLFDGAPVDFTPQEYRTIVMLMGDPRAVVSAYDIALEVHGRDDEAAKNAVEAIILRIRRKTASDAILTRRGFGYTLEGPAP